MLEKIVTTSVVATSAAATIAAAWKLYEALLPIVEPLGITSGEQAMRIVQNLVG